MADTAYKLVEAARDVLLDEGLARFSMRKVASRCGVSATAIYRHFEDRDALIAATVGESFGIFAQYLSRALTATTPLLRFRHSALGYFAFASDHPRYYQLVFMTNCEELGMDRLDEAVRGRAAGTFQMLVDRVEECQRAGVFQPGDSRAQAAFVWSSLHGLAALRLTGNLGKAGDALGWLEGAQVDGIVAALRPSHTRAGASSQP